MLKIPPVKLVLNLKHKDDAEGFIIIRISVPGGKPPYVKKSTGIKIAAKLWNAEDEIVRKAHPESGPINKTLRDEVDRIKSLLEIDLKAKKNFSRELLISRLDPKAASGDFFIFYKNHIDYLSSKYKEADLKNGRQVGDENEYIAHLRGEYDRIVAFSGQDVTFAEIDANFLRQYEMKLSDPPKGLRLNNRPVRPVAATTLHTKMKRLKEIITLAIEMDHMHPKQIAGYKWPTYKKPEKPYLTLAETTALWQRIYKGNYDNDPVMKQVACYFLIECYAGIRFSDWKRFEIETLVEGSNLKVNAKKNGQPVYIPLDKFPRLKNIIDYVIAENITFSLSEGNTNRVLKIIASDLKVNKHLTTHIGRHTCGTLLGEMGWNNSEIAEVLGISEQTAKVYVKNTRQRVRAAANRLGGL